MQIETPQEGTVSQSIQDTLKLLQGKSEKKSTEISEQIWQLTQKLWPKYNKIREDGKLEQLDAMEYVESILDKLENENSKTVEDIKVMRTEEIPDNTQISLQQVIENFMQTDD